LKYIPKIHRSIFKNAIRKLNKKVKPVIQINGEHYVPVANKTVKSIVIKGVTYIPVRAAPKSAKRSSAIVPKTTSHIDTFKIENITYIPLSVIPKVHRAVFKPTKKVVTKKTSKTIIKINGDYYTPITKKTFKPLVVNGITYIPVHTAPNNVNKISAIVPKTKGHIDTFKIGKITYIPLNVIPKVHRTVFKPVLKAPAKKS
jgi:hypothetical protein